MIHLMYKSGSTINDLKELEQEQAVNEHPLKGEKVHLNSKDKIKLKHAY